ncbi:MAG: AAA family ATPase [Ignavibacteriaceae bacterium]|nr:AAA family ATPase [Ignavibacteriaceae bacterium]
MKMIISVLNLKGGSGKSTISTNLAVSFATDKKKVLLIDTDPQATSIRWAGERPDDRAKVAVVAIPDAKALRKQVKEFIENYDFLILDGAPQLDLISTTSIAVSNIVLIPVSPSPYDVWATENIVQRVLTAKEINPALDAYFILNRDNPKTLLSKDTSEALKELGLPIFQSKLNNRISYADSALNGLSVIEWTDTKAKEEFLSLYQEIKKLM